MTRFLLLSLLSSVHKIRTLSICLLLFCLPGLTDAQLESFENLEETTKKGFFKTYFTDLFKGFTDFGDPFTMTGGVGLNLRSYDAYGGDHRQDPFFYSLNANANARIYKINIPLSVLITAKNTSSSFPNFGELGDAFRDNLPARRQRFVRLGMSPSYKWIKLHLGHRAMNFSKFTLANLNFFGAGAELTPGNWQIAAMSGRLAEARPIDLSLTRPNLPVFQRSGWGTKLGYGTEQGSVEVILFGAKDDLNSIEIPDNSPINPSAEENFVLGFNAQQLLFERFRFKLELGVSAVSPNLLDAEIAKSAYPGFLFTERTTTDVNTAIDASINYEGERFTGGVQLRRIDPNYESFGAYFFNNDIIDLLGNLNFGLLDGAANVSLSAGVQSNNLDLSQPTTNQRFVYNAAIAYAKNAFSANANYSNNTTDVGYVLNQELDSLNAVLIMENAGLNFTYAIPSQSGTQHVFNIGGNLQQVSDDIENPMTSAASRMIVGLFNYSLMLPTNWRFTSRLNYNQNELSQMTIDRFGAGLGVSKSLLEGKMNMGLDLNQFWNSNDVAENTRNLQGRLRWTYQISEGLNTNLSWGLLRTTSDTMDPFTELTGIVGLQYNFNYQPGRKKQETEQENNQ
jgi:hypothetical protein